MPSKPKPGPSGPSDEAETVWVIYEGGRPPPGVPYIDGTAELVRDDATWHEERDLSEIVIPDDFD